MEENKQSVKKQTFNSFMINVACQINVGTLCLQYRMVTQLTKRLGKNKDGPILHTIQQEQLQMNQTFQWKMRK